MFLGQNFIGSKIYIGSKKFWVIKILVKKNLGKKNFFCQNSWSKNFKVEKILGSTKIFGLKNIWVKKTFG